MIDTTLLSLAQVVLPDEVLDSFEITKVESPTTEIHIHLDEKMYASLKVSDRLTPSINSHSTFLSLRSKQRLWYIGH